MPFFKTGQLIMFYNKTYLFNKVNIDTYMICIRELKRQKSVINNRQETGIMIFSYVETNSEKILYADLGLLRPNRSHSFV